MKSIRGQIAVGNKITARIEPPKVQGMAFKPKVLAFETNIQKMPDENTRNDFNLQKNMVLK